jgi:hypothetical protein
VSEFSALFPTREILRFVGEGMAERDDTELRPKMAETAEAEKI